MDENLKVGDYVFIVLDNEGVYKISKGILYETVLKQDGYWDYHVARVNDKPGEGPVGTSSDVFKTYERAEAEVLKRHLDWKRRHTPRVKVSNDEFTI